MSVDVHPGPGSRLGRLEGAHSAVRFAVRYGAVPSVLVATFAVYGIVLDGGLSAYAPSWIPPVSLAFVAASIVLAVSLVVIEALFPYEPFEETTAQRLTDVAFNVGTAIVLIAGHPLITDAPTLLLDVSALPFAAQFVIGWAAHDLVLYGWHRLLHESGSPALWRLHAWHHEPARFTFMAGGRSHLVEIAVTVLALVAARMVFGVSGEVMAWVLMCPVVSGAVHHTNVDFRMGPFNWVFPGPEVHRVHHDRDPAVALNYATSFPAWDALFGTARPGRTAGQTAYGMDDRDDRDTTWAAAHIPRSATRPAPDRPAPGTR